MSPLEIWCNESQERYVIIVKQKTCLNSTIYVQEKCILCYRTCYKG